MSTLCIKNTEHVRNVVHVNGLPRYEFDRVRSIVEVTTNTWEVTLSSGVKGVIDGGKALGGSRRDWFLTIEGNTKPIPCTSIVDAIRCFVTA